MLNNKLALLALRTRVYTAAGVPALRSTEGVKFKPTVGSSWIEENYIPGTSRLYTGTAANGMVEETGLSVWKWYEPENTGIVTISDGCDAIMAKFTPGTVMALSDGTTLRVRTDVTVKRGQVLPDGSGWVYCQVTIPWIAWTTNIVAA